MTAIPEQAAPGQPAGQAAAPQPSAPSAEELHRVIAAQRALACAPPDPNVILDLLAQSAWSLLHAEGALAAQPDGEHVVARGTAGAAPPVGTRIPAAGTLAGLALRSRQSQLCYDGATDARTDAAINQAHRTRSSAVVPLVHEGEAIGIVAAISPRPCAFDENDLSLLSMLAEVGAHRLAYAISWREWRAADEAVRQSERRLAAALQLARLATWELDPTTGELRWSREMYAMLGLDPATFHPTPGSHRALIHPDDIGALDGLGKRVESTRSPQQMVVRARHADGDYRFFLSQVEVNVGEAGDIAMLWGTTQDITEREQSALALAASEQHFRVAFENAPIGMAMISLVPDTAAKYLSANNAFCQMLGYTHDEIASLTIPDLTHPEDLERDQGFFQRILRGETTSVAFEKRYVHRDGRTVFAWLTSSVAQDSHGEPLYLITHAVDVTERRKEQAELERLALTDTLTGLANRTLLGDRLDQALARLQRSRGCVALLLLDVDRFKLVNDSLGHQVGDALLVEMAGRLEEVTRADSTVARLGGDEFVVLTEGLRTPEDVHAVAARLLATLRRPYTLSPSGDALVATVSIGISVATSADRAPSDLYREADLALYRAKDAGRDQYALFDDELRARAVARLASETMLRRALAEDLLVPVYQPIVDLTDGRITGVEVLARIQRPDGGLVEPAEFIDVAEETGLIVELDARMFELAVGQVARWRVPDPLGLRKLTTNLSGRSLEDPLFAERMRKAMAWYDVPGSALRIELTERSLLSSSPAVPESLRRIADLDIAVGLDDFGTGYSALAYLQRFRLHFLKIDRSFVARLGSSRRDDAVVGSVIDLAHAHELVVIAEGVETAAQLEALRALGCDRAQGYLIGRPMTAAEFETLVRSEPRW